MTTIQFLAGWALRSSVLILSGALLLRALGVKDPCIRLAAWATVLCGSLAIPVLTAVLPGVSFGVLPAASRPVEHRVVVSGVVPARAGSSRGEPVVPERFDWSRAAVVVYILGALALLVRLCVGLALSVRLFSSSRATGQTTEGIEIRESGRVGAPVTLGIARTAIVLPSDWRQWESSKLEAVLAHERSHIRRLDPAVQVLSAIHRALLWHSPLSSFLHNRIVRVAEEASDDAAVAATGDRALYAEVLLEFMQRGVRSVGPAGSADGPVWPAGAAHRSHSGWNCNIAGSYTMVGGGDSRHGITPHVRRGCSASAKLTAGTGTACSSCSAGSTFGRAHSSVQAYGQAAGRGRLSEWSGSSGGLQHGQGNGPRRRPVDGGKFQGRG